MFHLIWVLIIGGIIGAIAGAITSRRLPAGWVGNIVAGIIGSYLGELLLGNWGPQIAGMAVFRPSLEQSSSLSSYPLFLVWEEKKAEHSINKGGITHGTFITRSCRHWRSCFNL